MKPRFLLDEHISKAIQRQLRRMDTNLDVLAIGDQGAPATGTSDPDILLWIEENGYILVTENRSTIPVHIRDHYASGHQFPGVFWIRPGTEMGAVINELYIIWMASDAEDYRNSTFYIPL